MMNPSTNPLHILESYRKSDAVVIVSQQNQQRKVQIEAVNEEAARLTGLSNESITGKELNTILPPRIQSTITEFLDFKKEDQDLLAVIMKIRNFAVVDSNGQEHMLRVRVIRGEEVDRNPWFHLILEDESKQQQAISVRQTLRETFKANEKAHAISGMFNRPGIIANMEIVLQSVKAGQIKASFAIMDINNYAAIKSEHGDDFPHRLQRHIGSLCKQKLRPEDTVASLNDRMIGLLLVDAAQEEARQVLNRLRWIISVSPIETAGKEVSSQVNIGFAEIDGKIPATEVVEKCENFLHGLRRKHVNTIELVVTHERRAARVERRVDDMPVETERRKAERRSDFFS